MSEASHCASPQATTTEPTMSETGVTQQASSPSSPPPPPPHIPPNQCYLCHGIGHWARDCPSLPKAYLAEAVPRCYACGGEGHFARACPSSAAFYHSAAYKQQVRKQAQLQTGEEGLLGEDPSMPPPPPGRERGRRPRFKSHPSRIMYPSYVDMEGTGAMFPPMMMGLMPPLEPFAFFEPMAGPGGAPAPEWTYGYPPPLYFPHPHEPYWLDPYADQALSYSAPLPVESGGDKAEAPMAEGSSTLDDFPTLPSAAPPNQSHN